jgi:hypothetical protein
LFNIINFHRLDRSLDSLEELQRTPKPAVPVMVSTTPEKVPNAVISPQDVDKSSRIRERNCEGKGDRKEKLLEDERTSHIYEPRRLPSLASSRSSAERILGVQILGYGPRPSGIAAASKTDPPEERQMTPKPVLPATVTTAPKQVPSTKDFDESTPQWIPRLESSRSFAERIIGLQIPGHGPRSSAITAASKIDSPPLGTKGLSSNEAEFNKYIVKSSSETKSSGPGVARKSAVNQIFRRQSSEAQSECPPAEASNSWSARKDSSSSESDFPISLLLARKSARKSAISDVPKDDSNGDIAIEEAQVPYPSDDRENISNQENHYKSPYTLLGSLPKVIGERDVPDGSTSRKGAQKSADFDTSLTGSKIPKYLITTKAGRKYAQYFDPNTCSESDQSDGDGDGDVTMKDAPQSYIPKPECNVDTSDQADPDTDSGVLNPDLPPLPLNPRVFSLTPPLVIPTNTIDSIPTYDPPPKSLESQRRIRALTYDPSKLDGYIYRPRPPLEQPGFDNFREDPEYIRRQTAIRARGGKKGQFGVTLSVAQILENRAKGWLRGQNCEMTEKKLKIWTESKKLDNTSGIIDDDSEERIAGMANPRYVVAGMKDGNVVFGDARKKDEDGKQIYFD